MEGAVEIENLVDKEADYEDEDEDYYDEMEVEPNATEVAIGQKNNGGAKEDTEAIPTGGDQQLSSNSRRMRIKKNL